MGNPAIDNSLEAYMDREYILDQYMNNYKPTVFVDNVVDDITDDYTFFGQDIPKRKISDATSNVINTKVDNAYPKNNVFSLIIFPANP